MNYFIVLPAIIIKVNKLTESQIEILANYYSRKFDAWKAWEGLCNALERHDNCEKYYIYSIYVIVSM